MTTAQDKLSKIIYAHEDLWSRLAQKSSGDNREALRAWLRDEWDPWYSRWVSARVQNSLGEWAQTDPTKYQRAITEVARGLSAKRDLANSLGIPIPDLGSSRLGFVYSGSGGRDLDMRPNGFRCTISHDNQLQSCLTIDGKDYCQSMNLDPVVRVIQAKIAEAHEGLHRDDVESMEAIGADYSYLVENAKRQAAKEALKKSGARAVKDRRSGAKPGAPVAWGRSPAKRLKPATRPVAPPPLQAPQEPQEPDYDGNYDGNYDDGDYDDSGDYDDCGDDGDMVPRGAQGGVSVSGWFDDVKGAIGSVGHVISKHRKDIANAISFVAPGAGSAVLGAYALADQVDKAMSGDPKALKAIATLKVRAESGDPSAKEAHEISKSIYQAKIAKAA